MISRFDHEDTVNVGAIKMDAVMNYLNFSALKFHVVWNVIDPIEIDSHEGTSEAV